MNAGGKKQAFLGVEVVGYIRANTMTGRRGFIITGTDIINRVWEEGQKPKGSLDIILSQKST